MIAIWMLYAIVVGAFVLVAASALDRAARALGVPLRFIWASALIAAVALPLILPFADFSASPTAVAVPIGEQVEFTTQPAEQLSASPTTVFSDFVGRYDRELVFAWITLSLLLLSRVVTATIGLWRRRAEWVEREIDGVRLHVTPDLGPAVVGIPDTRIIIPQWMLALDSAVLSTVIRHERQHRDAGDPRLILAGSLLVAAFPWNPAIWYLRRRLRLALEMDCDARVLAEDPRVDRYGSLLLAIAQHPRLSPQLSAALTESTSDLERRIDAMTTRPPARPRVRAALFATLAIAAIVFACAMPAPDATGPNADKVEMVEQAQTYDFKVTNATPEPGTAPPRYPAQLRAAGLEGSVTAKFVVDTNGRADIRTFEVLKSSHDAFTAAVREHLPYMVFRPAQVVDRKVKQLVQMPFVFSLARDTRVVPEEELKEKPLVFQEVPVADTTGETFPELITRSAPIYPQRLRAANIEGQVVVSFTVKTDGTVDMSTFQVVKSDHDLFATSVRRHVAQMRFRPKVGASGKRVAAGMTMPFAFTLAK